MTMESANRGSGEGDRTVGSDIGAAFLDGCYDQGAAERQVNGVLQEPVFEAGGDAADGVDARRREADIAHSTMRRRQEFTGQYHYRKQDAVPVVDIEVTEIRSLEQGSQNASTISPGIVDGSVVARQQPLVRGQVQQQQASFREAAAKLPERRPFV